MPPDIKKPIISAAAVAMTTSRQLNLFVKSVPWIFAVLFYGLQSARSTRFLE